MSFNRTYPMQIEHLKSITDDVRSQLMATKSLEREAFRAQLFIEETMLFWLDHIPGGESITLTLGKRFKTITLTLSYCEIEANPLAMPEDAAPDESSRIGQNILMGLLHVAYAYDNGINKITYTLKEKRRNEAVGILAALAAAILSGLIVKTIAPHFGQMIAQRLLAPLDNAFFGLLNATIVPLLFVSVIGSIFNMENLAQVKRIFAMLTVWFAGISLVTAIFSALAAVLFYPIKAISAGAQDNLTSQALTLLGDFVPANLVTPFVEGNTFQVIFLAVLTGLVLLSLKGRFHLIPKVVEESNLLFTNMLEVIISLMPLIVFASIFDLVLSGDTSLLVEALATLALVLGCMLIVIVLLLGSVTLIERQNLVHYLRTIWPFIANALYTASSSSTFVRHEKTAVARQGVRNYLAKFAIPVGALFCKPFLMPINVLVTLFVAGQFGVPFSLADVVSLTLISLVLTIAVPPAPGIGPLIFTILFGSFNIPMEGMAIAVTLFILLDHVNTVGNVLSINVTMLHTQARLDSKPPAATAPIYNH